jgi:ferredoxin
MTQVNIIQSLFFSPTGTTRKVINTISKHIELEIAEPIDLTLPNQRKEWKGEIQGDLLLVGAPIYADTIPSVFLEPLNRLDGGCRWVVPVVVYGNVYHKYGLKELVGLLRYRGFKVLGAGIFIGEHSFNSNTFPIACNRPDAKDLQAMEDLGMKIREKIRVYPSEIGLEGIPLRVGEKYLRDRDEWPENRAHRLAKVSDISNNCTRCNLCVEKCPMKAIESSTLEVNDYECVRCFACVRACPTGTRKMIFNPDMTQRVKNLFSNAVKNRMEPKYFF